MWAWKKVEYFSYETEQKRPTNNNYSEKIGTKFIKATKLLIL